MNAQDSKDKGLNPRQQGPDMPASGLAPGDDAAPGTPGTGEDICPACRGSGKKVGGGDCPNCQGSGKVTEGIGGG